MARRTFNSFKEAGKFAREVSKPGESAIVRHTGDVFEVQYEPDNEAPRKENHARDHHLENEVLRLESELQEYRAENAKLEQKNDSLKDDIAAKENIISEMNADVGARVAEQTAHEKRSLNKAKIKLRKYYEKWSEEAEQERVKKLDDLRKRDEELSKREIECRQEYGKYKDALDKFELLKKAYAKKFGKATVEEFERAVTTKDICHNCAGDGGATGQCRYCDGTGWEEKKIYEIERSVRFR